MRNSPVVLCVLCLSTFLLGAADRGCVQSPDDYQRIAALGTSATNPATGECQLFAQPADMPAGWAVCDAPDLQTYCIQVITPARASLQAPCQEFATPCDVPDGWVKCPRPVSVPAVAPAP